MAATDLSETSQMAAAASAQVPWPTIAEDYTFASIMPASASKKTRRPTSFLRQQNSFELASSKLGRRRSTLGTLSNASNDDLGTRRASVGSVVSQFDLLTALQHTPAALRTDRKGRMDLLGALMVSPDDVLETRTPGSRRTSVVSETSSAGTVGVDLLQALRAGPSLARRPLTPLTPLATKETPRSSFSSQSGPPPSSTSTFAPLLRRTSRKSRDSSTDVLSITSAQRNEAQELASAMAFAALRRRVAASRSDVALQLIEELAAAAAEHACAPTSSTARELDQVAQEVADSHGVGQALTQALARGGYPPLALCPPADAARLCRDLRGLAIEPVEYSPMLRAESHESERSEELLDEGRKRWFAWRASQEES